MKQQGKCKKCLEVNMASFLASAAQAGAKNLGIYLQLIQSEEHQKRVEQLQAKRDQVEQQRWETDRADTNAYRDKQLGIKKQELSNVEISKVLSMFNGYEKDKQNKIGKIDDAAAKEIKDLLSMGQQEQASKVASQAEQRVLAVEEQYNKLAKPYRNKLVASGYLPKQVQEQKDTVATHDDNANQPLLSRPALLTEQPKPPPKVNKVNDEGVPTAIAKQEFSAFDLEPSINKLNNNVRVMDNLEKLQKSQANLLKDDSSSYYSPNLWSHIRS